MAKPEGMQLMIDLVREDSKVTSRFHSRKSSITPSSKKPGAISDQAGDVVVASLSDVSHEMIISIGSPQK
jgi:hypothetical protein